MKWLSFIIVLAVILSTVSNAQVAPLATSPNGSILIEKAEPQKDTLVIPYEKWKLKNGLTLIIHEDHSDPMASVAIQYHVGSARETAGRSGFAHFFEHMLFQGSEHVNDEEHFKLVSEAGGSVNGFTQEDVTVYFETLPSNSVELGIWLEADRMGFFLDSATQQKFEVQRATVKNEKAQNYENSPGALGFGEIRLEALYPPGHPYSWPVIGYTDDLDRATLADLKNFFLRWYGPNNATLCVAGDVNPKEILALTEKYFGSIQKGPDAKKLKPNVPILAADKYASYVDNLFAPTTILTFPAAQRYHKDEPALDMLAEMLGSGKSSILYKNFVKNEKAAFANSFYRSLEISGEIIIGVSAFPDPETDLMKQFDQTEKDIRAAINDFEKTEITDESVQRARAKKIASILSSNDGLLNRSIILTSWHAMAGKQYNLQDEVERYNKVTKEDILRVYNKYLKNKFAAFVNIIPRKLDDKDSTKSINPNANVKIEEDPAFASLKYVRGTDNFDRSVRPVPGPPKSPVIPQYYKHQLSNGLKITGTQTSEVPLVYLRITISGGNLFSGEESKKAGVAEFTAAMMDESTQGFTAEKIDGELEKLGSSITFSGGNESTVINVNTLSKNLDATLLLLEEKLLRPKFDPADFKRVKKQIVQGLYEERSVAAVVSNKLFRKLIYGNNALGAYMSVRSAKKLTIEDVKSYYDQYYAPGISTLVAVGDVSQSEILPKLEFLNKWQKKEVTLPAAPVIAQPAATQIYVAHIDFAKASEISLGYPALPFDYNGDYFKANIMNHPLGGNFNSRLNLNLREDKGFTYGIGSGFYGSKYPGYYEINCTVGRTTATDSSLKEIIKVVNEFKSTGITDNEVSFAKNSRLNSEALRYETPIQKALFLQRIMDFDLPMDYTTTQEKILRDITKDELNSLMKKYINPDKMIVLVVGNKYAIKGKLEKLGIGKVTEVELD